MLAVGVFTKPRQVWSNLVHEYLALSWLSNINHFLHYIVGVLILHHDVQCAVRQISNKKIQVSSTKNYYREKLEKKKLPLIKTTNFFNKHGSFLTGGVGDALFNDVAGELVLRKS